RRVRKLHARAQRNVPEVQHLRQHERVQLMTMRGGSFPRRGGSQTRPVAACSNATPSHCGGADGRVRDPPLRKKGNAGPHRGAASRKEGRMPMPLDVKSADLPRATALSGGHARWTGVSGARYTAEIFPLGLPVPAARGIYIFAKPRGA